MLTLTNALGTFLVRIVVWYGVLRCLVPFSPVRVGHTHGGTLPDIRRCTRSVSTGMWRMQGLDTEIFNDSNVGTIPDVAHTMQPLALTPKTRP